MRTEVGGFGGEGLWGQRSYLVSATWETPSVFADSNEPEDEGQEAARTGQVPSEPGKSHTLTPAVVQAQEGAGLCPGPCTSGSQTRGGGCGRRKEEDFKGRVLGRSRQMSVLGDDRLAVPSARLWSAVVSLWSVSKQGRESQGDTPATQKWGVCAEEDRHFHESARFLTTRACPCVQADGTAARAKEEVILREAHGGGGEPTGSSREKRTARWTSSKAPEQGGQGAGTERRTRGRRHEALQTEERSRHVGRSWFAPLRQSPAEATAGFVSEWTVSRASQRTPASKERGAPRGRFVCPRPGCDRSLHSAWCTGGPSADLQDDVR